MFIIYKTHRIAGTVLSKNDNRSSFSLLTTEGDPLPIQIRKELSKINSCVFNYGKYINAFKEIITNGYTLKRVIMKEDRESAEIVDQEDIKADEELRKQEILCLGFLGKVIIESDDSGNAGAAKGGKKSVNPTSGAGTSYEEEINGIDEVAKAECAKIYTGNYAKYLNATEKIPDNLVDFLKDIKLEMELLRLNCVRELRTYVRIFYLLIYFI